MCNKTQITFTCMFCACVVNKKATNTKHLLKLIEFFWATFKVYKFTLCSLINEPFEVLTAHSQQQLDYIAMSGHSILKINLLCEYCKTLLGPHLFTFRWIINNL